jgi:hypothetical protein
MEHLYCPTCKDFKTDYWKDIYGDFKKKLCKECDSTLEEAKVIMDTQETLNMNTENKEALRFNEGKVDYSQLPLDLLEGACKVLTFGASKYTRGNYRKGYENLHSPLASIIRHLVKLQQTLDNEDKDGSKGHLLDAESGEAHVHHLITSTIILIHAMKLKGYKV